MDWLGYDFNVVIPSVAWLDSNQAATADAIKGSECKVLAKCEVGPPPVLHRIYANWNWRWIPNWHPRSMFWTGKVHPFIFSILGLRHLRYSCLLSTTFLDREMSKSCSSQHELTATGSFPPSSRWHPDTGRCVEGCERGVWKRGLGLQHDSPWSHAVSQCCFKEQSMQMSALGYPDEVCMIPEEEW